MSIIDRIKNFFNRITGREEKVEISYLSDGSKIEDKSDTIDDGYVPQEYPEGELVSIIGDDVLDADSREAQDKLRHNLSVLIQKTKNAGKVEQLMLIREDDVFPKGWQWDVASKNTALESVSTPLSYQLRKAYALREAGIEEFLKVNGMKIPNATHEQTMDALSKVDKKIGNFLLPEYFRSTKHFTVNTPLESTGNYNFVDTERDFIVIDKIDNFLKSGYGYSIANHDAYLDVSHEGLEISEDAMVLINDKKFDRIMADPKVKEELAQRKVVRYKGDTAAAIAMVLTEAGALPMAIGTRFAEYDMETRDIIQKTMQDVAIENGLLVDRNHFSTEGKGHFSSYYDDKNNDVEVAKRESIEFLIKKFPEHKKLFDEYLKHSGTAGDIVDTIGIDELLSAIEEYNNMAIEKQSKNYAKHLEERQSITPKEHEQFVKMVSLINKFYVDTSYISNFEGREALEENVQMFFQGDTLEKQKSAMPKIWEILRTKFIAKEQEETSKEEIVDEKDLDEK